MNIAYELFLLLFNLTQLRTRDNIIQLFTEGMSEAFKPAVFSFAEESRNKSLPEFEIGTPKSFFGFIQVEHSDELTSESKILIQNSVQMLAVILERLTYEQELENEKSSLENVAVLRNSELQKTVEELQKTRLASLNLIEDLTEEIEKRKQYEKELKKSESRFSTAFKASPAPLVISEIDTGIFINVNNRWIEMLGYSKEEQIGETSKKVGIWRNPSERDRIIQFLQKNGSFKDEYIEFNTKSGDIILALWSAETIDLGGKKLMLSMIHDITKRVKAENELRELKNNLEIEVQKKTQELRERISELERFHEATIEREFRIKELRDEVERLKRT